MTARGIRLDTEQRERVADVAALRPDWVSVVAHGNGTRDHLDRYRKLGYQTKVVIARESYTAIGLNPYRDHDLCAQWYRALLVTHPDGRAVDAVEVGNEPDVRHVGPGGSSYEMTQKQFQEMLAAWRSVWRDSGARLIVGGAGTGQPSYYAPLDLSGYQLALHSYDMGLGPLTIPGGQNGDLGALLGAFGTIRERTGLQIRLTEIGLSSPDEAFQALYARSLVPFLDARGDVDVADWFCLADWQVAPHGLLRRDNTPKAAYAAWQQKEDDVDPSEKVHRDLWRFARPNAVYNAPFGLETAWRAHRDAWGYPLTDGEEEVDIDGSTFNARTFSKAGLVYWDGEKAIVWGVR